MTHQAIFDRLTPLIQEVTGVSAEQIKMEHVLVVDLGAESLDLLDLSFLIEEQFGITLESDEFERQARQRIPGGIYEHDGFLTDEALAQLRAALPEIDPGRLVAPFRKTDLPYILKVALDRCWAQGNDPALLQRFKELIAALYPPGKPLTQFERQRIAEDQILTVYLHAHMDEDTLDLGRLMVCPDQVPDPAGRMIPACAYNLFYRMQDPRFYVQCKKEA